MFKNSLFEENVICQIHNERIVSICLKKECESKKNLCYKCIISNHITNHSEKDFEIYCEYLQAFNEFVEIQKKNQESHYVSYYKENLLTIIGDYKNKIDQMFENLKHKIENESQTFNSLSQLKLENYDFESFERIIKFIELNNLSYKKELKCFDLDKKDPFENQEKITEEISQKK